MGIPRERAVDSLPALLLDGYEFGTKRFRRHRSNVFEARLMLERTVVMRGPDAARIFYAPGAFTRVGATPRPVRRLLQRRGGVQMLDGPAHHDRKRMFMRLMTPGEVERIGLMCRRQWLATAKDWPGFDEVVVRIEAERVFCRTICDWTGIPLADSAAADRARDLARSFDGVGSFGWRHLRVAPARRRVERWLESVMRDARTRGPESLEDTPLGAIVWYRDAEGSLLDHEASAAELLNVARPAVAVARYVEFMVHALRDHPHLLVQLRADDGAVSRFVQEVRRWYPFFPAVGGRALRDVALNNYTIPAGRLVLLDLFGTNRDERVWGDADDFRPGRFRKWNEQRDALVPQGAGEHEFSHRCAGEWMTIELMREAAKFFSRDIRFEFPDRDVRLRLNRVPARPRRGMRISDVSLVPGAVDRADNNASVPGLSISS